MPCPHYSISVVSRGSGQSVMAAASYCLGQKLYAAASEYCTCRYFRAARARCVQCPRDSRRHPQREYRAIHFQPDLRGVLRPGQQEHPRREGACPRQHQRLDSGIWQRWRLDFGTVRHHGQAQPHRVYLQERAAQGCGGAGAGADQCNRRGEL